MKAVVNKRCEEEGCDTRPSYGIDCGKPTHCSTHGKIRGMKDVVSTRCEEEGCDTLPSYGIERWKPTHCSTHGKLRGLKNVVSTRCEEEGCDTFSSYGIERWKPTHCSTHGKLRGMKDVVSTRCEEEGCDTFSSYGIELGKPTYCSAHGKLRGMKDVKSRCCEEEGCDTKPSYGIDLGKPTHCSAHGKLRGMKDVKSTRCEEEGCDTRPSKPWAPFCAGCYAAKFPDDPLVVARNKTEAKICEFLNATLAACISASSTFNAMNVRGRAAPPWLGRFEMDFVLCGGRVNLECDGGQHFRDVAMFRSSFDDQLERDVHKTLLALEHGVSVVRVVQEDVWADRGKWKAALSAALAFALERGEPAVVVCGDRAPYAPYLRALSERGEACCYTALALRDEDGLVRITAEEAGENDARIVGPPVNFRLSADAAGECVSLKTAAERQKKVTVARE
jgi:very-short-patch-repair endonuclease